MKKRIITLVAALGLAMLPAAIAGAGLTYDAGTEVNAPSGSNPSVFGISIAISSDGSTLVVGDSGAGAGSGAAFVYRKSGSTWNNVATLTTSSGTPIGFGKSITVSADGATVVVGDAGAGGGPGAAFVYQEPTSGWATTTTATATLTTSSGTPNFFGFSITVSADGSTVVAGDPGAGGGPGAAFVYQEPTSGWATTTTATATLTTSSGTPVDFGNSITVSADGSTVVVGDPAAGGGSLPGAAFVYQKSGGGWVTATTATATLTTSSGTPDLFGFSITVSADGATVVVGDPGAGGGPGAAFVYQEPTSGWVTATTATATLTTSSGTPVDFGWSITISADGATVVVGDPQAGGASSPGAAFVFHSTNVAAASVLVAGSLAVQPQNIPFPSANVGLTDVTVSYDAATGTDPWRVRGDASTWSVTLQVSGDFSNGAGGTIPVDAGNGGRVTAQIEAADITGGTGAGTNPTSAVTSATALSTSAALTILTAVDDGGTPATGLSTGLFDITPVFTLNVPGTTPAGSFNTTVVATVVAGP